MLAKTKKKNFQVPHVYIILLGVIFIFSLLTYIIPAGEYARVEAPDGRMVVDASSFNYIKQSPVNIWSALQSIPKGLSQGSSIIFFIFIVGGAFGLVSETGAINAAIARLSRRMNGRERALIPVIMFVFSLGGSIFGMAEETLPFIPMGITLAMALGFDSLTGAGMVLVGASAGFAGAFMNPFTIGVAQGIAGLPIFSGMSYRIFVCFAFLVLNISFIYLYAGKIKKDPTKSLMYDVDKKRENTFDFNQLPEFTIHHKLVLWTVLVTIVLLIFGVIHYGWYITQIGALFLGMSMVVSLVYGYTFNEYAQNLVKGMSELTSGALVVGFATGILVVLDEGHILDPILFSISHSLAGVPPTFTALGMYLFQCLLNFIVPSGSGQAAISMPIMAPLADLSGVSRQTAVLAYQLGDGISNIFTPTSGYFMAGLALAKISWDKWAKWILPLILLEYLLGGILITIAHMINFGPF
ncbi:YfcC family protein [Inediibacterium massiliense]|uniref:YfcC family protein n=1 Tax=Inediibacterium massiliense TaxID=1658111 RepID=UPI0006B5E9D0|nr:AbgT family transporter [Inediibacterium massiliense]